MTGGPAQASQSDKAPVEHADPERRTTQQSAAPRAVTLGGKSASSTFTERRLAKTGPANSSHTAREVAAPSPLRSMMTA